jgi:hypothetical protein
MDDPVFEVYRIRESFFEVRGEDGLKGADQYPKVKDSKKPPAVFDCNIRVDEGQEIAQMKGEVL